MSHRYTFRRGKQVSVNAQRDITEQAGAVKGNVMIWKEGNYGLVNTDSSDLEDADTDTEEIEDLASSEDACSDVTGSDEECSDDEVGSLVDFVVDDGYDDEIDENYNGEEDEGYGSEEDEDYVDNWDDEEDAWDKDEGYETEDGDYMNNVEDEADEDDESDGEHDGDNDEGDVKQPKQPFSKPSGSATIPLP